MHVYKQNYFLEDPGEEKLYEATKTIPFGW